MAKIELNFVGGAYDMLATQLDAQNCINWYLTVDPTGKYKRALLPRPGLQTYVEIAGANEVRGILGLRGNLYAVIDSNLYLCYSNGSTNKIEPAMETSSGLVSILANEKQLFITDGKDGYVYQIEETDDYAAGDFFKIESASSTIGTPIFNGSGLDDLSASGSYTGVTNKTYKVQIDGDLIPNTFRWSDSDGETWNAEKIPITTVNQLLSEGVFIRFTSSIGHTLNDDWDIPVTIDSAFYAPIIPSYQDGYGVYPRQNTSLFYISALDDFSKVNASDFAQARVYPDDLVGAVSIHDELYLIGGATTEIWYNTGNVDFPFERKLNLILNYGCEAPFTIQAGADNLIFMLATNYDGARIIVKIVNYSVTIVSTEPINQELAGYEKVDDAFSFLIERNGHIFFVITFPTADRTWVYDITTNLWHEWRSLRVTDVLVPNQTILGKFRGTCHTVFDGEDLIGDDRSGKIFKLTESSYKDDDDLIICERTAQHISQLNQFTTFNYVQIDAEAATALVDGYGSDPQLMFSVSKDGGRTFGSEMWRSLGKVGRYKNRAIWYRLGTARVFTYRIRNTDPVYKVILGAIADVEVND